MATTRIENDRCPAQSWNIVRQRTFARPRPVGVMDLTRGITGLVGFLRFKDWVHFLPLVLLPVRGPFVEPRTLALSLGASSGGLAFAFGFNLLSDEALDRKP